VTRKERAARIQEILARKFPAPRCALHHESAFQLLCATILSAQCTDERVNKVTPALFARFPDPRSLAGADPADVTEIIRSTGFFNNKTKSLIGAAFRIVEDFEGTVPETMEELLTLPGVARKTANVVLGTWFGKNVGVVVDTHVTRLSRRMGLTRNGTPEKIERDLMKVFPREEWTNLSHRLILHGRGVCAARMPRCADCAVGTVCPSYDPDPESWRNGKKKGPAKRRVTGEGGEKLAGKTAAKGRPRSTKRDKKAARSTRSARASKVRSAKRGVRKS
jgi:endonuclease-3